MWNTVGDAGLTELRAQQVFEPLNDALNQSVSDFSKFLRRSWGPFLESALQRPRLLCSQLLRFSKGSSVTKRGG